MYQIIVVVVNGVWNVSSEFRSVAIFLVVI